MNVRIMTGWSIIIITLAHNVTMIFLFQSNKIIAYAISPDIKLVTLWSVNAIALSWHYHRMT